MTTKPLPVLIDHILEFFTEVQATLQQFDTKDPNTVEKEALKNLQRAFVEAEVEFAQLRQYGSKPKIVPGWYAQDEFGYNFGPYQSQEEMLQSFGTRKPSFFGRRDELGWREGNFPVATTPDMAQPPSDDERQRARAAIDRARSLTKQAEQEAVSVVPHKLFFNGVEISKPGWYGERDGTLKGPFETEQEMRLAMGSPNPYTRSFHVGPEALSTEQREGLNAYEPPPKPSEHPAVWDLVMGDIRERDAFGEKKYGQRLKPFDGRDPLVDLYQELLDAVVYTRKAIYERAKMVELLKEAVEIAHPDHDDIERCEAFTAKVLELLR